MMVAEKQADVSKIMMEKEVMEKLAFQKIQQIEGSRFPSSLFLLRERSELIPFVAGRCADRMYTARQKALSDAQFCTLIASFCPSAVQLILVVINRARVQISSRNWLKPIN